MNSGPSKIRTLPPKNAHESTDSLLERLGKLDQWSQEPAVETAASIGVESRKEAVEEVEEVEPTKPAVKKKPAAKKKAEDTYPWHGLEKAPGVQANFRLPAALLHKLKFLGETTYGQNQTKIAVAGIEEIVNRMLKERGIND